MSHNNHQTISVADYIKVTDLTNLVNNSVNACAATRPHPSLVPAFLSQHFHKQHFESPAAVSIDSIALSLCGGGPSDGTGTPGVQLTLTLLDGRSASALVAHSCGTAVTHPTTSRVNRRVSWDLRQRAHRAKAVTEAITTSNDTNNKLINILCNAIFGSGPAVSYNNATATVTGTSTTSGGGNNSNASAAKPQRDFDILLSTADGSTNFSVLGSNIAAAASIAFCKIKTQIQRTPLGLHQSLYKLLAKDFEFLQANSVSNSAQTVAKAINKINNNNNSKTFSSSTTNNNKRSHNNGNNTFSALSSFPIPLVPLFAGSDAPVFGKLRILKQVVIYPNPKFAETTTNIPTILSQVQQVVNVCYDKLTTDEATQQPPIMLPHAGGLMKHLALETFAQVVEFVEECIKEALNLNLTSSSSATTNPGASTKNSNAAAKENASSSLNDLQQQQQNVSAFTPETSPILVGLILDGSLCSMREGLENDEMFSGLSGAVGGVGGSSPGSKSKAAAGSSKQQQGSKSVTSPARGEQVVGTAVSSANNNNTQLQQQQPPPKYQVIEGAAEWTAAQLSDHLAALVIAKPIVGYIQDSHREDGGGKDHETSNLNDSWRRLMARVGPAATVSIAGDELFATNQAVIERLAPECVCNTLVVRINDAGTVTNAMNCARCFTSIVPGGSVCVAPEICDGEASTFLVDFAFAIGAKFLHLNSSTICGPYSQGASMLIRYGQICNELLTNASVNNNNNGIIVSSRTTNTNSHLPTLSSAPDYSQINFLPPEPIEPLGQLEIPTKDAKKRR
jgi:enolase